LIDVIGYINTSSHVNYQFHLNPVSRQAVEEEQQLGQELEEVVEEVKEKVRKKNESRARKQTSKKSNKQARR
jgi:hypothetical protein